MHGFSGLTIAAVLCTSCTADNGTYVFSSLPTRIPTENGAAVPTPTQQHGYSALVLEAIFSTPTRTRIEASTVSAGPSSWLSASTDWSLVLDRLFPNLNPSQRTMFKDVWDCDVRVRQWSLTEAVPTTYTTFVSKDDLVTETYNTTFFNRFTYQGCDGIPRIGYSGGTPSYTVKNVTSILSSGTTTTVTSTHLAMPVSDGIPCTIANNTIANRYCHYLFTVYKDYRDSSLAASSRGTLYPWLPFSAPYRCGMVFNSYMMFHTCYVKVADATLMYWPTSIGSTKLCGQGPMSQIPGIPKGQNLTDGQPQVVTISGTGYTYPTVYITYSKIDYFSGGSETHGIEHTHIPQLVASYLPHEVSSLCGVGGNVRTLPFNFQDLEGEVPWSAYNCSLKCTNSTECLPLDPHFNPYSPYLAWPQTFLSLLHSWNTFDPDKCVFGYDNYGIPDPPHLLTTALQLTEPMTGSPATTTAAVPVTAEPAAPSIVLSVPPAPTTTLGPAPSPDPPHPKKNPDLGEIIATMINQPPGGPQQSLEVPQQRPKQPGSLDSNQNGNDPASQQVDSGPPGNAAGQDQPTGPPRDEVGDPSEDEAGSDQAPGPAPGQEEGSGRQSSSLSDQGSNNDQTHQTPNSDPGQDGKSSSPPANQGIGAFIASMLNRPPMGAASTNSPPIVLRPSDPSSRSDPLDPNTVSHQGDSMDPIQVDPQSGGNQHSPQANEASDLGSAQVAAGVPIPLSAMVTLGAEVIPVQRLPNNAHVLHGLTYYAGDAITTAGHTMSFAAKGVVVDGSSTVAYSAAPYVTVSRPVPAAGAGQQASMTVMPAVLAVGGNMVAYGSEMTIAGKQVAYGSEGLVVGTWTVALPRGTGAVAVTLDRGEMMLVSAMTATTGVQATGGQAGNDPKGSEKPAGTGAGASPKSEAASGRTAESGASEAVPSRTGTAGNGDVALTTDGKAAKPNFPASSAASGLQNGGTAMAWCLFAFMVGLVLL